MDEVDDRGFNQATSRLTKGLFYSSETDAPLEVMTVPSALNADTVAAYSGTATGPSAGARPEVTTLGEFFRSQSKQAAAGDEEAQTPQFNLL